MKHENLGRAHRWQADRLGPLPALRYKRFGKYTDLSWADYREQADRTAIGLMSLGIQPGDHVGLLSENRHEWLITDIGVLSCGAADVPMHSPLSPKQVEYQLGHSQSRGVFVSNQVQADKVLESLDNLPNLEFLIHFDHVTTGGRIKTIPFTKLKSMGFQAGHEGRRKLAERESLTKLSDLATIIYTSGTTGNPKGVMLSHGNLLSNALASVENVTHKVGDIVLNWLPLSHSYARCVDHYVAMLGGVTIAFAESIETLVLNLAETQPMWINAVPRFYEKVWMAVEALEPATRTAKLRGIFGPRMERLSSGGAPLPHHVARGFMEAGLILYEGYGLTETSPVISFSRPDHYRLGAVGQRLPGVEIKIADDGEILTRGPHIMLGYWREPEATAATIDPDGWLHTGDVGHLDDEGYLFITDRKKDLFVTSGGKNIAPAEVERLLVSDLYIDQAVAYGDGRNFVSALIVPNFPHLTAKAQELGATLETKGDFLVDPKIRAFLTERIAHVMQAVSKPERVKKFLILNRPLTLEADELTATMKVRRKFVIKKYEKELAAIYDGEAGSDEGE